MHRRLGVSLLVALVGGLLTITQPANASFHRMAISEIFTGTTEHETADYVELTMLADDQDEVMGTRLRLYDADGDLTGTQVLDDNLSGGDAGEQDPDRFDGSGLTIWHHSRLHPRDTNERVCRQGLFRESPGW